MIKSSKLIMILASIVLGIILIVFCKGFIRNSNISDIPKESEVAFIEIYADSIGDITKHHTIEGKENIAEIYDVFKSGKKSKSINSLNDTPADLDGKLTRIVLNDASNTTTVLFAFQGKDGKAYIEKPYSAIYEISEEDYEVLTQYFIE